jgi:nitrite reductase/ring-hydroxylating ferredoxin subunit
MTSFIKVALVTDIPPNSRKVVELEGVAIVIFNVDESYFAVGRYCPHEGGLLDEGTLDGTLLTCPLHGITFDLATGVSEDEGGFSITKYNIKLEDGSILLDGPLTGAF